MIYFFDYNGTLDTLLDPVSFIKALKAVDPNNMVLVMSGGWPPPEVINVADGFYEKPFQLDYSLFKDMKITICDDDPLVAAGLKRALRRHTKSVTLIEPGALVDLLPPVSAPLVIHNYMVKKDWKLITAESVTCGLIAAILADQPGCSAWHRGGFAVYDIDMKVNVLGVDRAVAEPCNCVSVEVARQMAAGAARLTGCEVAIATTGYAEPLPDGTGAYAYVYIKIGEKAWDLSVRDVKGTLIRNEMRDEIAYQALQFLAKQMA